MLVPEPGALQHDGEGLQQSPLYPGICHFAFPEHQPVFAASLAAAGNQDLNATTLFAACLTEP